MRKYSKNTENEEKIALEMIKNEYNKILEYIHENGKITRHMAEKVLNVSKAKALNVLADMLHNDMLFQIGNGKNTYYVFKK